MAFDQNSVPKDLRPLNIVRNVVEDPRITPMTTSGRPIEGFYANPPRDVASPNSIPAVYYPATVPETGFVGLGFAGNAAVPLPTAVPVPGVAGWVPRVAPPSHPGILATTSPGFNSAGGSPHSAAFGPRVPSSVSDQASDEGTDDSVSGRKVKFMCSFGGKILPRPSDGALRYVGGQTRIISVRRDVSFGELVQKMVDTCGQNVVIKYQLPEEDLDALVSVSCPDDLENMMDEYEKLIERSSEGSAKLRVFLFSASEVDSAGMVHIGDWHDGGQKYVEAVNGYMDGSGRGGISRKESTASSTQSSDLNGTEVVDSLGRSQGEVIGPPSTGVPSPRENFTTSQEAVTTMVGVDPSHGVHVDASASPLAVGNTGHPPMSAQSENESERSLPIGAQQQQVGSEFLQTGASVPAASPYLQGYVDHRQEALNRADYVQAPTQMGFPTQLLSTVGPVFTQPHVNPGAPHQQFIPTVHMTMVPSSHVSMNPNLVPSLVQPQQIRLEPYPAESSFGQRVVHVPADQGYNAYHAPVPAAMLGAAYGWHHVPQTEQVTFSEGHSPHQQAMAPERIARFDDCFMCQKALPHAHSDTVAQDQRESPVSTISDSRSIYHSLRLDDKGRPINRAFTAGALVEGAVDQTGTGPQSRVSGNLNPEVGHLQPDGSGLQQNVEGQYEKDRILYQKADNSEFSRLPVQQGVGITTGLQSPYGVFVGNIPQTSRDNVVQPVINPATYQVKQDIMMSKPASGDIPVEGMALQSSDHLVDESPKDYSGNVPASVPGEDNMKSYAIYDHLRQIDGRMENLRVSPSEMLAFNEQNKSPIDNPKREDILENRRQQVIGREPYSNESSYVHNLPPAESYEMAQPPILFNSVVHPHSKLGVNLVPDDTSYNPVFSGVDSAHTTERIAPIGERRDNTSRYQPNIASTGAEAVLLEGNAPSVSPSYRVGDIQDSSHSLFSNQDPWNLRNDSHFPPPRPSKIQIKKEPSGVRDPSGDNRSENNGDLFMGNTVELITEMRLDDGVSQAINNLNIDGSLENPRTNKGSTEEQIKQELQAVAEGVAASVLQSSPPSNHDLSGPGRSESPSTIQQNSEVQSIDRGVLNVDKFDEIKGKLPEKTNIGFPASDSLGRLQIIKNSDLEELRELGSGTFGTVYHGKWRGTDVAIKRINDRCFAGKPSEQERMRDDFWNEAIKLADLHHPNVVAFYGVVLDGPGGSVATVTEYMVNGSLRTALQKSERNLDKRKRLLIAMDVAFGMEYLHGKNIVHFDLKSDNLLVNLRDPHRPICKVGDLGLSKVKCQTLISGGVRGTLPWMAPELLNGSSSLVSEKVDVYSFGIVMWELLTGEEPYADLHYGAIIGGIVSNTLRPSVPESCDPDWRSLMERCWAAEPSERPSFTEIANELRSMASKIPPKGQNQQPPSSKQPQVKS
ncbi:hypothetical protein M9H77_14820 [Catharanthus roseus]|uniref:Uncharacterized protein n=1 Tax=Catharanthus roseus TaxID=4058 RepID=A0ACC0BPF6_CATRO|nr:hypothetical protein M9H77_14820 [Catharanthus roseus]